MGLAKEGEWVRNGQVGRGGFVVDFRGYIGLKKMNVPKKMLFLF